MAKKKKIKAKAKPKKKARKQRIPQSVKHEIVVRVDPTPTPTVTELAEPLKDGKKLTIPRTWVTEHQLTFMLQRTPKQHVYKRAGRGGQVFDYVTGGYIQKALNYAFGWNWDFEIVEHGKEQDHVWVMGKLTVRGNKGEQIVKTQFGRSEVKKLKSGAGYVDYGNDLKAAATDALKKCASMLGFASDIYGKADYKAESGEEPKDEPVIQLQAPKVEARETTVVYEDYLCAWSGKGGCGKDLSKQQYDYSKRLYGRPLCGEHQKQSNPIRK